MCLRRISLIAAYLLTPGIALACVGTPDYLRYSHEELIQKADTIVLAETGPMSDDFLEQIGINDYLSTKFQFSSVRVLKGEDPKGFVLEGYKADEYKEQPGLEYSGDFENHSNDLFWTYRGGNYDNLCDPHGLFSWNATYLIFLQDDRPVAHIHSFELIEGDEDQWLKFVETTIAEQESVESDT